jgi:alanine racemase
MSQAVAPVALIDLQALAENYRVLCERARPAAVGAAVKANAYGLGLAPVARILFRSGCRTFFVAHFGEALALRAVLPRATIAVLHGLRPDEFAEARARDVTPVINDLEALRAWQACARQRGEALPAFVHLDTGMNRLGLSSEEQDRLATDPCRLEGVAVRAWISHLACADQAAHPKTPEQLCAFRAILSRLPRAPVSFANSSGIFWGRDYLFDLVRPGAALYGINPTRDRPNPMRGVVTVRAPILQVRCVDAPMTVGYGATHAMRARGRVAAVALGYADGYPGKLGGKGQVRIGDHLAPVVGRISMDLVTVDVSAVPDTVAHPGAMAEFIGANMTVDQVASAADTIGYEILTGLGPRIERVYTPAPASAAGGEAGGRANSPVRRRDRSRWTVRRETRARSTSR